MSKQKVVIDTDCGVDDAFAFLLALADHSPADVLAVTCCYGNTSLDYVVPNVMRVLTLCDKKEIPVYRGSNGPLSFRDKNKEYAQEVSHHGKDGLGNCSEQFSTGDMEEQKVPAAQALVELSLKHPGEITLIAVAPLTNVALAHRLDPKFTARLKALYIMGGNYKGVGNTTESAEFNFYLDPEAADIVLDETICKTVLVPWETTIENAIQWETYDRLVEIPTPKGNFLKCITKFPADRARRKGNKKYYDCDLLAMAAFLYPESITDAFEKCVAVECAGKHTRGLTVSLYDHNPIASQRRKVKIVTGFDVDFLDEIRFKMLQN